MNIIKQNENINDTNYFLQAKAEIDSWFFVNHNWPVAAVLTIYASFIFIDLKLLKNRKPIDPKFFMFLFNIYQVVSNAYMVYAILRPGAVEYLVNHTCHPADQTKNPLWFRGLYVAKLFMISKLADLIDTVFIVLRKRQRQISFLHFYHHFGMVLFSWYCLKNHAEEQFTYIFILNPTVHIFMYTYYCLSLMGKSIQKYLWWKNYITLLQLIQFVIYMIHAVYLIVFRCDHSVKVTMFYFLQSLIFFSLFMNFYNKKYRQKKVSPNPVPCEKAKVT